MNTAAHIWNEDTARRAAEEAARSIGCVSSIRLIKFAKQAVFAAFHPTLAASPRGPHCDGSLVALRVINPYRNESDIRAEHSAAIALAQSNAPVMRPLINDLIETPFGLVGVWEWINETQQQMRPEELGSTLFRIHTCGADLAHVGIGPFRTFISRVHRLDELARHPGHPLANQTALIALFRARLESAAQILDRPSRSASPRDDVLLHGDYYPANVRISERGLIAIDLEYAGIGPRAYDFAILALGIRRYGWSYSTWESICSGYGPLSPSFEATLPYVRLRELADVLFLMEHAHLSAAHENELHKRAQILDNPNADTAIWEHVGDRASRFAMQAGGLVFEAAAATGTTIDRTRTGGITEAHEL